MINPGKWRTQDCLLCAAADTAEILCDACAADLPPLAAARCPRCALPTPNSAICGHCLAKPPHFDATFAAYAYDFPLDKLVQSFKYGHRLAVGGWLGRQLATLVRGLPASLVIPLPLHRERLRERGFNQALELARPVAQVCGWRLETTTCRRVRHTPAQAGLAFRERAGNVRGAFHCTRDFSGCDIVLVDDVMTTGASLDECARTLKLHGARTVTLLVVARALPH